MKSVVCALMVVALVVMWSGNDGFTATEATRVAPWSMAAKHLVTRQAYDDDDDNVGMKKKTKKKREEEELPPLAEQEKVMALREDMDAANRELMAFDPYYTHW